MLMGVVNVTPDSFSDGGQFSTPELAVEHALRLVQEGADMIDIGGESTRPGALPIDQSDEIRRVLPVVESLRRQSGAIISVDTSKPEVAWRAVEVGADVINDVTGFQNAAMINVAAQTRAGLIAMHMQGSPQSMQIAPMYDDVLAEVRSFLGSRIDALLARGIAFERIAVDPGIGFGKTWMHNLILLREIAEFHALARPICLGASRKGFISRVLNRPLEPTDVALPPRRRSALDATSTDCTIPERDIGTAAVALAAWASGVQILRVHHVALVHDALRVFLAVTPSRSSGNSP